MNDITSAKAHYLAIKRAGLIILVPGQNAAIGTWNHAKWCESIGAKVNPDLQAAAKEAQAKRYRLP